MHTLIRNLSTHTFLHTEIYHVAFLLEKKSGLLLQCSQRSFVSERSGISEQ